MEVPTGFEFGKGSLAYFLPPGRITQNIQRAVESSLKITEGEELRRKSRSSFPRCLEVPSVRL
jgi:hypothetical protein